MRAQLLLLVVVAATLLGACDDGTTPSYKVGGTVSGLSGTGLVLRNNAADLPITANGPFQWAASVASRTAYAVTVASQPTAPAQVCTVTHGSGTVGSSDVTDIDVACINATLSLVSSTPANNATNVARSAAPALTFSVPVNASTVSGNVVLKRGNQTVPAVAVATASTVTLTPASTLLPLTTYTVTVSTGLQGSNGEPLGAPVSMSFTTRDRAWQVAGLIETDNAGYAVVPQIAFDAADNALAVWIQDDGTYANIMENHYVAGSGWGTATPIQTNNADIAHGPRSPQIAYDAAGNALAVWHQSDGTRDNIWANRHVAGGGWGIATLIETDNAGSALSPQIAVDAAGNALAVWTQHDGTGYNVWANRHVPGSGWGIATLIETDNAGDAGNPQIAVDAAGNALAVWSQFDGTRFNIWANRHVAGSGWGTATLIETNNVGHARDPQIAFDAAGNALAVWQQDNGTRDNIWANRHVAGSGWGTAAPIETGSADHAVLPQIAFDAAGNALAVWQQHDGTRFNIWANRHVPGSGWETATLIETSNAGDASDAQIAVDAAGNALAVWHQHDGTRFNIWANRHVAGSGWGTATLIETNNAGSALYPQIAVDAAGNALAVWHQYDGTRTNIWANQFQ